MTTKLGRRLSIDARDQQFLLRRKLAPAGTVMPTIRTWAIGTKSLNQGNTGSCVGHAWRNFLRSAPIKIGPSAWDIYRGCVQIDQWADNDDEATLSDGDPGLDTGTSVRAGAQVVTNAGLLKSYLWAFELQPVVEWVLTQGPIVLGVNWYSSMFRTDKEGIIKITSSATLEGGHAILCCGMDTRRALALLENSWGDEWGKNGTCYLPLMDLERLIREQGEACAAVKWKVKAKAI